MEVRGTGGQTPRGEQAAGGELAESINIYNYVSFSSIALYIGIDKTEYVFIFGSSSLMSA